MFTKAVPNHYDSRDSKVTTASYKGLLKKFDGCSNEVKRHFEKLPYLIRDNYSYEISIAYLFLNTEKAQNRALYGGVVKIHKVNAEIAERAVNTQHLTRDGFRDLFKNIFGHELSSPVIAKLKEAESIRDKVVHGKKVSDSEMRKAICDILDYAESMNQEMYKQGNFKPFGDMRGFKGRAQSLEKAPSRWLLKGLGFSIK